jgi:catechol 2,3-dioxygenase-like lactoylglutathione lyase family enzyme
MKLGPSSVAIMVTDTKKAVRWYTTKLGFDLLESEGHWAVVGDKAKGIGLHLCESRSRSGKPRLEPGNTGIMVFTDAEMMATYKALKRKGVKFPQPPEKTEWGWYCMFADPDGNQFWLAPRE